MQLLDAPAREALLDFGDLYLGLVARSTVLDEDDKSVDPGDGLPPKGNIRDVEREVLAYLEGSEGGS